MHLYFVIYNISGHVYIPCKLFNFFDIYLFTIYHYKSFSLCNGSCDISSTILGFYEFGSFFVLVSQLVLFTDEDIFFGILQTISQLYIY